jgi:hypothetical protein
MHGSSWNRWLKPLSNRRARRSKPSRRLDVTRLESREVPAFTAGDLVLYRVGAGASALAGNGTAVFLDDYTTAGALISPNAMPTTASGSSFGLTAVGTTTGDGLMNVSSDGRYLLVPGYNLGLGTNLAATTVRVVGRVGFDGTNPTIDTTTGLSDGSGSNTLGNLREAASLDGGAIWTVHTGLSSALGGAARLVAGGQGGTSTTVSSTLAATASAMTSLQGLSVFGNQLYVTGGTGGIDGVATVGSGLPTTGGNLTAMVPGFPGSNGSTLGNPSPRQFIFTDANTVYVADSNAPASNNTQGGLQKWTNTASGWRLAYIIPMTAATEGLFSVVADPNNAGTFYGTTAENSGQNKLVKIVDGGSAGTSTVTVLATAPTNEAFRGVAFVPKVNGTTAVTSNGVVSSTGGSSAANQSVTFTATVTAATTPSGYVTFEAGSTVLGQVALTPGSPGTATAQFTTTALPVGATSVKAYYGGDLTYASNLSSAVSQTVAAGTATTTSVALTTGTTPAANTNVALTYTATVTGGVGSTGSVTFFDNGVSLGSFAVSGGSAQVTVHTGLTAAAGIMVPGFHAITASYSSAGATGGFNASSTTTPLIQIVTPSAFGAGHLVLQREGDGVNPLTAATLNTVYLDERTTSGTLVQSIALPTSDNGSTHALTVSGTILGDGILNNTADGRYLLVPGYDIPLGAASATTAARVIGRVDSNGNVDTTTALTESATGANNLRNAASADGYGIWNVGSSASQNLQFATIGTVGAPVTVSNTINGTGTTTGLNSVWISNNTTSGSPAPGSMFVSGGASGIDGVQSLSGNLPPTSGQTITNNLGFPTTGTPFPQARQFIFSPDGLTIYVADSRTGPNSTPAGFFGGLQVWKSHSGTFGVSGNPDYVITPDANQDEGLLGFRADFSGANPTFYAVTAEAGGIGAPNKLLKIVDMGSAATSTVQVLVTAPANENFTGAALAPTPVGTTALTNDTLNSSSQPSPFGASVTFTATLTGDAGHGTPTGWVTFQKVVGGVTTTIGIVPLQAGGGPNAAFAQFTDNGTLPIGSTQINAVYGGDGTYATQTSNFSQNITGAVTNTVLMSNNGNPGANGASVTFTATVTATPTSAGQPTGTVDFFDNGLPLNAIGTINVTPGAAGSGTSTAMLTVSTNPTQVIVGGIVQKLTPGIHNITAVFTASGSFTDSSNAVTQKVQANAFGAGDILVFRAGDSVSLLSVNGNTVYIDEYTTAANQTTPVQSIVMPTTAATAVGGGGNQALITCSQQTPDGQLSLSSDGQYVYMTGYDTPPGGSVDVHTSAASSIPRTIGRIKFDGTIDTSMALTDLADGGDVRGVASDGTHVWATGTSSGTTGGGVRFVNTYSAATTTSTQVDDASNGSHGAASGQALSMNHLFISGGQLYVTDSANNNEVKVATVGSGLPTTSGQMDTILNGLPTGATTAPPPDTNLSANAPGFPVGVYFAHLQMGPVLGADTMYTADDGPSFLTGAITKWALISGTWTKVDTISSQATPGAANTTTSPIPSFDALNGAVTAAGTVNLYTTWGNGGGGVNSVPDGGVLMSIADSGGFNGVIPSHTITTLAQVGSTGSRGTANEIFRGVVPVPAPALTVANVQVNGGVGVQRSEVRSLTVTFSGPVTFAGGNANAANAFQLQQINDLNTHFVTPVTVNGLIPTVSTNGLGQTIVTLTFTTTGNAASVVDPISILSNANPVPGPSLADGRFQLTVFSQAVLGANGGQLAGGGANGNYVSPLDQVGGGGIGLFREFADASGDGVVDATDLGQVKSTFNFNNTQAQYLQYLDANNDGVVDAQDLGQVKTRFNHNVFQ